MIRWPNVDVQRSEPADSNDDNLDDIRRRVLDVLLQHVNCAEGELHRVLDITGRMIVDSSSVQEWPSFERKAIRHLIAVC